MTVSPVHSTSSTAGIAVTVSDMQDPIERTALRDRMVGGLRAAHEGAGLRLVGWVHRRRDLGGLIFLDLRDRSGIVQVSLGPDWSTPDALATAHRLGAEDVVAVDGTVVVRPEGAGNPELATGEVEFRARELRLLNRAVTPAIPVARGMGEELSSEELRLRHRNLDLRRPELQNNLMLRHRLVLAVRNVMAEQGFLEIETPILTKPTPEGARDYLVPSRIYPGEFFALPQSPQIYKQILMTAGFDRYMQIARCFRDEDLRADRQPEFTQIDVEASFIEPDDMFRWMEQVAAAVGVVAGVEVSLPFPRFTWQEVMDRYGSDRPDLRYALEIQDWTELLAEAESPILRSGVEAGGRIRGFLLEGGARLSRREVEAFEAVAKKAGAPGLLWAKRGDEGLSGSMARFLTEGLVEALGLPVGGLLLVAVGPHRSTSVALSAVRGAVIPALDLPMIRDHAWAWVLDFPLFEANDDGSLAPGHHPFVLPHPDDMGLLDTDPARARGLAYDLVYNGAELGSGSLRIHDAALQRRILGILGMGEAEITKKFGFLLEALESGAPPHGGIALGVDRMVKGFTGASSLRDVMAFPKTTTARALFEGAPTAVPPRDLKDLHLRTLE